MFDRPYKLSGTIHFYEEMSGRPAKKMACIKGGVAPMKESIIVQIFLPEWAEIAFLGF